MISRRGLVLASPLALALAGCRVRVAGRLHTDFADALPLETAAGPMFSVASVRGKVVLVTFIATWCFPCLAELVTMEKLEALYQRQGLEVVLVGMDLEGRKVLAPFADQYQLRAPLLVGDERLRSGTTSFGRIHELPAQVLFGRDGSVVAASSGVSRYQELERLVLAELSRSK